MRSEEIELVSQLIKSIESNAAGQVRLMEFCGGHTVAIMKNGIRQLLPSSVQLSSGPGCPVCVTAAGDIDKIIQLSHRPGVIIATFGDLIRVPGSKSSLQNARAEGCDVRTVYSALDALDIARQNPELKVVMIGIGFETTAPTIAASILQARKEGIRNYLVLSLLKLTPPASKAILDAGEIRLNGIICPGHVSSVIGSRSYETIVRDYGIACVITGFEPLDILKGIEMLTRQITARSPRVEIAYKRAVRPEGNPVALQIMSEVFEIDTVFWRGFGPIPESGLKIREDFKDFDAEAAFDLPPIFAGEPAGCLCGAVLRGISMPSNCQYFGLKCTPEHPVGPCMVSSEGACSAYYLYGDQDG